MTRTTVLVADALPLLSDALSIALAAYPEFGVYEERPSNGPAAIEAAVRLKPDFVIIDYWLPDLEGPVVTQAILTSAPECNVIVLSSLSAPSNVQQALNAGAVAFLPKDCSVSQVAEAIRRIYKGEGFVYEERLQNLLKDRSEKSQAEWTEFANLAPRELEILALLNQGNSTKQIAGRLSISPNTVRNYISKLLAKTDTRSATEVLAKARQCGFLRT